MLGFLYIFVWPFLLPLICIVVLSIVARRHLASAAALLAFLMLGSAAPLAYSVATSPYPEGLAISSLAAYPVSLAALICTSLARMLVIWLKTRQRRSTAS